MDNLLRIAEISRSHSDDSVVGEAVRVLQTGGIIALPTDTLYGFGCLLGKPRAVERIHAMRNIDPKRRPLTFLLPDLGEVARWARVTGTAFQILDRIFPGPFCVELNAMPHVGKLVPGERRTIGVRIPDDPFCAKLLWATGAPVLTCTAKDRAGKVLHTAEEIRAAYGDDLDLIVDAGRREGPPSTVVSLLDDWVEVRREGRGPVAKLLVD